MPRLRTSLLSALSAGSALTFAVATPALAQPGFTQPTRLGATADFIDIHGAVVAPTGRTAVLWRTADIRTKRQGGWRMHYLAAIGADPAHLGRPVVLDADLFAADPLEATLSTFPDGTLAACFQSDPRRGDAIAGCSFAPPGRAFGPLRVYARTSWKNRLVTSAIPRPDGRLVVLTSVLASGTTRTVTTQLMDPTGAVTPPQTLGTASTELTPRAVSTDDGTVAVTWHSDDGVAGLSRTDRLAVMRPTADRFDAPVDLHLGDRVYSASLSGGRQLVLAVATSDDQGNDITRYQPVGLDGTVGQPAQVLPRPTKQGFLYGTPQTLADGSLFAVVQAFRPDESDCDSTPFSAVGAGALIGQGTTGAAQRLSAKGQIAEYPSMGQLADGSVIATWSNSLDYGAHGRIEAAIRPAGAAQFGRPQVLPQLSRDYRLATGADQALLVWEVGKRFADRGHLVTSAFTRAGKLAVPARRPAHPSTSCD